MFTKQEVSFAVLLLALGAGVAAASLKGEPTHRRVEELAANPAHRVAPQELARWILEGRRDFAVVDLRDANLYAAGHVKDAVNCGSCHEGKAEGRKMQQSDMFVDLSKKLVLYTQDGQEKAKLPKMIADNPRLYVLEGGYEGWKSKVLAPVSFGGETDEEQVLAKRKQEAVRAFFAGEQPVNSAPAKLSVTPIRRDNAHTPAAAREGC